MKRESVRFFTRYLLLTVLTVVIVLVSFGLVESGGTFKIVIAILFTIVNAFTLIYMLIKSIRLFFRHISNKDKKRFELLYIINILFSIFITGLYLFFYFVIIMGAMIVLMPFLA